MSWINVIWLFVASASLTLASILLIAGRPKRSDLWFAMSALSVMALAVFEMELMRAATPDRFAVLVRWIHVPIFGLVASFVLFIRSFFNAGRPWLAGTVIAVRGVASLVVNFLHRPSLNYDAITGLRQVTYLGERVSVAEGVASSWSRLGELSSLLLLVFLFDVMVSVWRRGDRHRAALVGGSALLFVLTSAANSFLIHSQRISAPYLISVPFFAVLAAMSWEVAADYRRALDLSRRLDDAQIALAESDHRLSAAAGAADLGFWSWDVKRDAIWILPRGRDPRGFDPEERLDLARFLSVVHSEDRDAVRRQLETAARESCAFEMECRTVRPSGEVRWIAVRGTGERLPAGGEPVVRGVSIDVTRRMLAEAESRLRQSETAHLTRVMMLGELSGSLAHELNQPLTAILSNAQAALRFLARPEGSGEEIREILVEIAAEGRRAGEIIRRLRVLLKKGEVHREDLDIADVAHGALELLHSDLVGHRVAVATRFSEGLPRVRADRVQVEQVLLNLIANACDAMAETEPGDRRLELLIDREDGAGVRVAVADRGCGLRPEDLERVFEPYFTTKAKGMGLGLSVCRTIIGAHGGRFWVTNNVDRGATFLFTLPEAGAGVP